MNHFDVHWCTDSKRGFFMGNALVCGVVEKVGKVIRDMFFDV